MGARVSQAWWQMVSPRDYTCWALFFSTKTNTCICSLECKLHLLFSVPLKCLWGSTSRWPTAESLEEGHSRVMALLLSTGDTNGMGPPHLPAWAHL